MSLKASWTKNDTGILRKNDTKEKREELFVFGYSCKLFRDDEKALHIDQGKHLIPWMGDETLKIDRYDARGALHNLVGLEAPPGGYDFRMELTRQELEVEQLCDEERYRAMHTDEDEEEMYKEEELKRLHAAGYGQVGFNYDAQAQATPTAAIAEEVDEPFIVPEGLKTLLPDDLVLPTTEKLHAIIEKTAKFIASQGAQMEILLRAKQSDNSQFEFLNKDSNLHPYYEALTKLVKGGQWPEKKEVPVEIEEKHNEYEDYLHPSLASTIIEAAPSIPNIPYRWSAECDYSLLVSRVRGDEGGEAPPPPGTAPLPDTPPPPTPTPTPTAHTVPLQHQQPPPQSHTFYAASPMYYNHPPPPLPHKVGVLPHQTGVLPHQTGALPHQTGVLPHQTPALPHQTGVIPHKTGVLQHQTGVLPHQTNLLQHPPPIIAVPKATSQDSPKPMLAPGESTGLNLMKNYASDSDSDSDSSTSSEEKEIQIKSPPEDVKVIIEKMSTYVARNGDEFAEIVRAKNDPRFIFLEPSNEYHPFYLRMMREKRGTVTSVKVKKSVAPVSFSIKKQKEPDPVLPKPALPYESSSEEEADNTTEPKNDKQTPEVLPNLTPSIFSVVPTTVYKLENQGNNLIFPNIPKSTNQISLAPKSIDVIEIAQNSKPNITENAIQNLVSKPSELQNNDSKIFNEILVEKPKEIKDKEQIEEKNNGKDQKQDNNEREKKAKDKTRDKERHRQKEDKYNHKEDRDEYRKKSKKYKEGSRSRSKRVEKSPEGRKDKRDVISKSKKGMEVDEIISVEDIDDDELIDLTGDGPADVTDIDSDIEKHKQMERRRRAAEFLKKVGVDPAAAALPTSSLASALVDTLKKRAEEEKRKKKEKRRRHKYEHNGDETNYKKSKRKKYEDDCSDHDSKKKKKKKDKKRPTKLKKSKYQESSSASEVEDEPCDLPLSIDLQNTLRELRQTSPTRELELCGQNLPDVRHALSTDDESETGRDENRPITERLVDEDSQSTRASRKRKIRKEDREYSEGEWSSDSDSDSFTSKEKESE